MSEAKNYVRTDARGTMRVGDSRVSLDSVVYAFRQGHSPETICQEYPILTLEEVYGAIAYYLANRALVDDYLNQQEKKWDELRRKIDQDACPVVQRLRALKANLQQEKR